MSVEYGHRYWDGSARADESRDAAFARASEFKPGCVEVVVRTGSNAPWERDVVQPHTLEERFAALFEARRTAEELSLWRGEKLTELGLSPNPWSWGEPEHALAFQQKQIKALRHELETVKPCACYRSPFDHGYSCPHAVFTHAGVTYPMGRQFLDRDGARWAFYGENGDGEPLVKPFPFDDAYEPSLLADAVEEYGPLTAVDPLPEEGLF